ncbi:unnamed protein product [Toxocara canis]|uniref:Uncharacterized protein n=1 Tax=Toxocara canis TaxID=6265 RepID=A0A183UJI8_TOXCA|nr:unnamed protein product [Toxocara canis]
MIAVWCRVEQQQQQQQSSAVLAAGGVLFSALRGEQSRACVWIYLQRGTFAPQTRVYRDEYVARQTRCSTPLRSVTWCKLTVMEAFWHEAINFGAGNTPHEWRWRAQAAATRPIIVATKFRGTLFVRSSSSQSTPYTPLSTRLALFTAAAAAAVAAGAGAATTASV